MSTLIPEDGIIFENLEAIGYTGYIPKVFITDLLIVSRYKLLHLNFKTDTEYKESLSEIVDSMRLKYWLKDILNLIKNLSKKYNLRTIELYATKGEGFKQDEIPFSNNYPFELSEINASIIEFLNITKNQLDEIERLPEAVIKILTIASGLGNFIKTSFQPSLVEAEMDKYGDITKVRKSVYVDPLFKYRLVTKGYDTNKDTIKTVYSKRLVAGFFLNNFSPELPAPLLLKLLGTILLSMLNTLKEIDIVVYSFYGTSYEKFKLNSIEDIIKTFSKAFQLKLFPIDNSESLEIMMKENPGSEVLYILNVNKPCNLKITNTGCKINLISSITSKFNNQYLNICKQSQGTLVTI